MSRLPLATLLFLPLAADAADTYRVGVAQVDITPSHPIRLNGFGGRRAESEGVYQRIWAKAIAIEDETREPALLMTVDVLGIPDDIRAELARRFANKANLKPERLAITATHTHTGPMLKGANVTLFGVPIPKEHLANIDKYTAEFLDKLEQVGLEALERRKPAKLSYAIGKAGFAINRRTRGGPVDHDLPTLFVHDPDGNLRAVYTSYACHCVTLSHNQIGGDWAGFAMEEVERAFPGAYALVSVGCGADSNPSSGVTGDKVDVARLQGREIATEVKRLSSSFRVPVSGKLIAQTKTIELPLAPLPTRAQWQEKAKRTDAIGHHARYQLEKLDRGEQLKTKVDYRIQTWAFGDSTAMAFLPGEVVVDFSLRLKRELDGHKLWVTAYTNGNPCYIPSERILKEGGYEGGGAMIYYDIPVPFKPGLEEPIVATVKDQLAKTIPPRFDATKTNGSMPLSPPQSLAAIRTRPDLVVELVAAEPLLDSPVAIDFGPDGKLWVCEMIDYPEGKSGKFEPGGRIRCLEDTDRDGRMDRATTFLEGIPFPTGVTVWRKGILVCAAPDILFAEDSDGDGKADVVKKLFSGFGTDNYQARVNSLQYGLDGWVYGACGLAGGTIKSFNGKTYALGNRDFRIKPDTGELEPVTGASQQGRVRDDWGNWFGCDNSVLIRHYPLDDHYLKRNPHAAYPNSSVFVPAGPNPNRLYPLRSDAQRFQLSGPPGSVTAACGLGIYRDNLLGDDYRGNAFVCEPVNLCVHRLKLTPKGSTFEGHRPADEKDREFLASTDNWFRPVQAVTGPDGCLWIVDMYRLVIEHPRWIPPADLAKLDTRAGQGLGRIYRVRPKERPPRPWHRFDQTDSVVLLQKLHSPSGWERDLATEMLVSKADTSVSRALVTRALYAADPATRLHALYSLDRLRELSPKISLKALDDPDPGVRRWAAKYGEKLIAKNPEMGTAIAALKTDSDAQVRLQVAYSLGAWDDAVAAGVTLSRMAARSADDPFLMAAVLSSIAKNNVASALIPIRREFGPNGPPAAFVTQLARLAAAADERDSLSSLIELAAEGKLAPWKVAVVTEILGSPAPAAEAIRKSDRFAQTLSDLRSAALTILSNRNATDADRLLVLPLVGGDSLSEVESRSLRELLSPAASPAVRSAALAHIARLRDPSAPGLLLEGWKSHPPAMRAQILDTLVARKDGPTALLAAVEARTVSPGEIDAARRQRLLNHSDTSVRDRARRLLDGTVNADRANVIQTYSDLPAGETTRGKAVFTRVCAACHKLGDAGVNVGPDLAALANRTPAYLLQEILDPNRNLDSRYVEYQAVTKAEQSITGILAGETATTIILRGQQGKEETLLRTNVEELRGSGKSLMPEGIEKDVSKKEMADLLAYLTAVRPPPKTFPGNSPAIVKLADRRLMLRAADAEIYGGDVAFESEFKNIGMWHGQNDHVEWRFELPSAGTFDIFLDFACDAGSAGNELVIEGIDPAVRWKVPSTGAWSQYQTTRVGIVQLPAGEGRLRVRPAGAIRGALIDLRTVYFMTPGQMPPGDPKQPKDPTDAADVAKVILDDSQPQERRNRLIANNAQQSAALIEAMAKDIKDEKEEYRRIPWIWRVAVAAGKRNDAKELKAILAVSLPRDKEPLRHWQSVVVGGGVINGISLSGPWPGRRMTELRKDDANLDARWKSALKQSFPMADDEKVPPGTRYDALRTIALADWEAAEPALANYLKKDAHAELQMGSVSGLGDVESAKAAESLMKALPDLTAANRNLAIAAMMRTAERAKMLLDALAAGTVKGEWLTAEHRKALESHSDADVRKRAAELLKK